MFPPFLTRTFPQTPKQSTPVQQWRPQIAALLTLTVMASPLVVQASIRGMYNSSTASDRDPTLDQTFVAAPLAITVQPIGVWLNRTLFVSPLRVEVGFAPSASETFPDSASPGFLANMSVVADPLQVSIDLNHALSIRVTRDPFPPADPASWLRGPVLVTAPATKANWVKWSSIGVLDFTILKDNLAGERPLDWKGTVYALKMLGNKVVAYGANGVSVLTPSGNAFGLETIYRIGLKSKQAIAGDESTHYFVDTEDQLYELGQRLSLLNYSEYLSELGSPVLSWDPHEQLLYLCDGTKGFVYDPETKSLGRGPVNVSGIGVQDGTKYITSPAAITIPLLEVTTDTYDFGTRRAKTISSLEVGIDAAGTLQVAIQYRQKIGSAFASTNFYTIDNRAVKPLNCYGYEFRFLFKAAAAGWGHLDYLRVNGHVHDH